MDWRLIHCGAEQPFRNMAVDEAILEAFCRGLVPPTLRIYRWDRPAVSIGYFQSYERSIRRDVDVPVVRRPTGGRAVPHGTDITFSLVAPADLMGRRVGDSYQRIGAAVYRALNSVGICAEFYSDKGTRGALDAVNCFELGLKYELSVDGRKVLGSAQYRRGDAVLQQNSLILEPPDQNVLEAMNSVGWESAVVAPPMQALEKSIVTEVGREFGLRLSTANLTSVEMEFAEAFERKYGDCAWTVRRARRVDSGSVPVIYCNRKSVLGGILSGEEDSSR